MRGVIRKLYILNSLDFDTMVNACKDSLARGNCIIIFPEGTRTPRAGIIRLKKGAARLSLLTGAPVIPVLIGGTDKYGLGKHDPATAFNHTEKYIYKLRIQAPLYPHTWTEMEMPKAVRRFNAQIYAALQPALGFRENLCGS